MLTSYGLISYIHNKIFAQKFCLYGSLPYFKCMGTSPGFPGTSARGGTFATLFAVPLGVALSQCIFYSQGHEFAFRRANCFLRVDPFWKWQRVDLSTLNCRAAWWHIMTRFTVVCICLKILSQTLLIEKCVFQHQRISTYCASAESIVHVVSMTQSINRWVHKILIIDNQ